MNMINSFGIAFVLAILIPNIVVVQLSKGKMQFEWKQFAVYAVEGIGRCGCVAFMMINVPGTWSGFWFPEAFPLYVLINTVLVIAYIVLWLLLWDKDTVFKALSLSIIPSAIFLFSGVALLSVPLIVSAVMFACAHILISYKSVMIRKRINETKKLEEPGSGFFRIG